MRWIAKALVQRILSATPYGTDVNYALQRRVTNQLPRSDSHFILRARETVRHFAAFERHARSVGLGQARFYEFGAGGELLTRCSTTR